MHERRKQLQSRRRSPPAPKRTARARERQEHHGHRHPGHEDEDYGGRGYTCRGPWQWRSPSVSAFLPPFMGEG